MSESLWPSLDAIMFPSGDNPLAILREQQTAAMDIDDSIRAYIMEGPNSASLLLGGMRESPKSTIVKLSWTEGEYWYPIRASGISNEGREYEIPSVSSLKCFLETEFKSENCKKVLYRIIAHGDFAKQ